MLRIAVLLSRYPNFVEVFSELHVFEKLCDIFTETVDTKVVSLILAVFLAPEVFQYISTPCVFEKTLELLDCTTGRVVMGSAELLIRFSYLDGVSMDEDQVGIVCERLVRAFGVAQFAIRRSLARALLEVLRRVPVCFVSRFISDEMLNCWSDMLDIDDEELVGMMKQLLIMIREKGGEGAEIVQRFVAGELGDPFFSEDFGIRTLIET
jgi:hypothetical protein